MFAPRRSSASKRQPTAIFNPTIYYVHPLMAGPLTQWQQHLQRIAAMGFNTIVIAPLFASGAAGDLFLAADHERPHPELETELSVDAVVKELAIACHLNGLALYLDVVLARVAADASLATNNPAWFRSPRLSEPRIDPRSSVVEADAAFAHFDEDGATSQLTAWWVDRLSRLCIAGVAGFVCRDPHLLPSPIWRHIIGAVQGEHPHCAFLAWTPGLPWLQIRRLRDDGFAGAFSSIAWWDGRASWLFEEHELLRDIGSVINPVEVPFGPRLARTLEKHGDRELAVRHMLMRAAALGDGLLVPMGFEFGADRDMSPRGGSTHDRCDIAAPCSLALATDIQAANGLVARLAAFGLAGRTRMLTGLGGVITALLRTDTPDVRSTQNAAAIVINTDMQRARALPFRLTPLPSAAGAALTADQVLYTEGELVDQLSAGEIRVFHVEPVKPQILQARRAKAAQLAAAPRIVISDVTPSVDDGRFPAKRVIGEAVTISADIFSDGHALLAAETLWRAAGEGRWQRQPMHQLGNDRWHATILPEQVGGYEFTIEAWWDTFGTFCRELEVKRRAGADLSVQIAEGRALLGRTQAPPKSGIGKVIASALSSLNGATNDSSADILLCRDLREVMRAVEERRFVFRRDEALPLTVERPQAQFASWYELFPRSASDRPERHGTFDDVIRRLPAIRDMGFDVLYLTPIHPIGRKNRKGKNNSLRSEPNDVGSPYAIGSSEGGHDRVHPALGTIEDFRRLHDAAGCHGLEIALDFAVQCSPDHPWIQEHPEWFEWRPDGSVRYAENPPKKYEDIVNVDFYADGAIPGLWLALRDVVLFWAREGVSLFRVDNPHTKPLPFWEWLITQVRGRHPDVIFLSEAFTRPKVMYRLAKVGFSQSYTYFTWRNTKQELTDYFTELTTTDVKEFFRPHLFVNTPDINPHFLQTSGRPGFLIRAALAATLSGLWGMYSGFEICEAAPLPGREEYLDSEKYEIRVRDYAAPGNIVSEIAKLNRIRNLHPALQSHLGLRFYPAHNDHVIFFGKPLPAQSDLILVAVSLDPFHVQEATIEVPLWEWQLTDDASVTVHDLMRDLTAAWYGKLQRIRLDPTDLPFAIWRIVPNRGA